MATVSEQNELIQEWANENQALLEDASGVYEILTAENSPLRNAIFENFDDTSDTLVRDQLKEFLTIFAEDAVLNPEGFARLNAAYEANPEAVASDIASYNYRQLMEAPSEPAGPEAPESQTESATPSSIDIMRDLAVESGIEQDTELYNALTAEDSPLRDAIFDRHITTFDNGPLLPSITLPDPEAIKEFLTQLDQESENNPEGFARLLEAYEANKDAVAQDITARNYQQHMEAPSEPEAGDEADLEDPLDDLPDLPLDGDDNEEPGTPAAATEPDAAPADDDTDPNHVTISTDPNAPPPAPPEPSDDVVTDTLLTLAFIREHFETKFGVTFDDENDPDLQTLYSAFRNDGSSFDDDAYKGRYDDYHMSGENMSAMTLFDEGTANDAPANINAALEMTSVAHARFGDQTTYMSFGDDITEEQQAIMHYAAHVTGLQLGDAPALEDINLSDEIKAQIDAQWAVMQGETPDVDGPDVVISTQEPDPEPSADDDEPAADDDEPTADDDEPAADDDEPAADDDQPAADDAPEPTPEGLGVVIPDSDFRPEDYPGNIPAASYEAEWDLRDLLGHTQDPALVTLMRESGMPEEYIAPFLEGEYGMEFVDPTTAEAPSFDTPELQAAYEAEMAAKQAAIEAVLQPNPAFSEAIEALNADPDNPALQQAFEEQLAAHEARAPEVNQLVAEAVIATNARLALEGQTPFNAPALTEPFNNATNGDGAAPTADAEATADATAQVEGPEGPEYMAYVPDNPAFDRLTDVLAKQENGQLESFLQNTIGMPPEHIQPYVESRGFEYVDPATYQEPDFSDNERLAEIYAREKVVTNNAIQAYERFDGDANNAALTTLTDNAERLTDQRVALQNGEAPAEGAPAADTPGADSTNDAAPAQDQTDPEEANRGITIGTGGGPGPG